MCAVCTLLLPGTASGNIRGYAILWSRPDTLSGIILRKKREAGGGGVHTVRCPASRVRATLLCAKRGVRSGFPVQPEISQRHCALSGETPQALKPILGSGAE